MALSSTEAEYMALNDSAREAVYQRGFRTELGFGAFADVEVFGDNCGAQKLAKNPVFHSRTKHIDVRHHFVRQAVWSRQLRIGYTPTETMPADMLTKGLSGVKHRRCLELLGVSILASRGSIGE